MDVNRAIRLAVNTGETVFGIKEVKKKAESGEAKMIIVSKNCPEPKFKRKKYKKVPLYVFNGNNQDLGSAAGKPFTISAIGILKPGESEILSLK